MQEFTSHITATETASQPQQVLNNIVSKEATTVSDDAFASSLDNYSLEAVVDAKLTRFFDQIGTFYPENVHEIIMKKSGKATRKSNSSPCWRQPSSCVKNSWYQ